MRKILVLSVVLSLPLFGVLFAQPSQGRTFAVLVACGDYDKTELNPVPFTVAEMTQFRDVLVQSGVSAANITFLHDKTDEPRRFLPTRENILAQLTLVVERLRPEDSLIVALTGHGVQFNGDKFGYFCPLDSQVHPSKKHKLLPMEGEDGLLPLIDRSKAGRKLLIVNACRNNPPVSNPNLAKLQLDLRDEYNEEAPKGTVMLLACSQKQFSWFYDDKEKRPERRNRSLFMYHLTEAWKGSYAQGKKVTVDHLVAEVSERVESDAPRDFNRNQIPIVKRKFDGRWELTAAAALAKQITNSIGMKLTYIPPGKFLMGSPKTELEREPFDKGSELQHEVELTKGFYMGVHEVTQEEYQEIMGENPSHFKGVKLPVEKVSWDDAQAFCKKLSAKEGKTYRLPTEAEWEYACRAGTTTPFHFGETISANQINYDGNHPYGNGQKGVYREKTTPVGSFAPNAWGLHDMHGNVWEWCEDWYDRKYYENSPKLNPLNLKEGTSRVIRGGSWYYDAGRCRSANRYWDGRSSRYSHLGFRVARSSVE